MKKEQLMIVDGHVHIHPSFDIQKMLDFAIANFRRLGCEDAAYFIALSESCGQNYFAALRQQSESNRLELGSWRFFLTEDPDALLAKKLDEKVDDKKANSTKTNSTKLNSTEASSTEASSTKVNSTKVNSTKTNSKKTAGKNEAGKSRSAIYILAGRQIVTKEDLEVLALATDSCFEEGQPLEKTIQAVLKKGGIPVVPWGFGKWIGTRGRHLQRLVKSAPMGLFFADSSSRPTFWSEPLLFDRARRNGLAILSGTDPFPLKSEVNRVGLAGFKIAGILDDARPATSLRQALLSASRALRGSLNNQDLNNEDLNSEDLNAEERDEPLNSLAAVHPLPSVYGPLETPYRCFKNQLAMQFVKRFRSHA